ncbi:MAG TPA: putative motility protein [Clostridiaceae bacterium]|nr:putative motility protein [Clostridiaceae bacterium]
MDIAALSMGLSQMKVAQQASISVMKMAMNTGQTQMNDLLKMMQVNTKVMEQSVNSYVGSNIDIKL